MANLRKINKIINLRMSGKTTVQIAEEIGCSNQYISQVLKKHESEMRMSYERRIAEFSKVPYMQFAKAWRNMIDADATDEEIHEFYDEIKLPQRATAGSAGYDFFSPMYICLNPGETIHIPSGIRCKMPMAWCLLLMPKSGLGTRYRIGLNDTVGLIDADYYYAKNSGHIMITLTNNGDKKCAVGLGKAIVQGVFLQYGLTIGDYVEAEREGGFGSTGA